MSPSSDIFVFWDESAQPKSSLGGFSIVQAIRSVARNIGVIKSLRFYVDILGAGPTRILSSTLTSELQCAGVTAIDTISNGRTGAPSKMMMADLFLHVLDHQHSGAKQPALLVITSDPDLSYGLSLLKARGQAIVLLCPPGVDCKLLKIAPELSFEGDMLEVRSSVQDLPLTSSSPAQVERRDVAIQASIETLRREELCNSAYQPGTPEMAGECISISTGSLTAQVGAPSSSPRPASVPLRSQLLNAWGAHGASRPSFSAHETSLLAPAMHIPPELDVIPPMSNHAFASTWDKLGPLDTPSPPAVHSPGLRSETDLSSYPTQASLSTSATPIPSPSPPRANLGPPCEAPPCELLQASRPEPIGVSNAQPPRLTWAQVARKPAEVDEAVENMSSHPVEDTAESLQSVAATNPSLPWVPPSHPSLDDNLPKEEFTRSVFTSPSASLPSGSTAATARPPPEPTIAIGDYAPLIIYLRKRAKTHTITVYQRRTLVEELRGKMSEFFQGAPAPSVRAYVKEGIVHGVLSTVNGPNQVQLSPAFKSAHGFVASDYVTLVDFLRDRKAFRGPPKIDLADLQDELLRRQPDIFIQAKTDQFKTPIKLYIRKASDLGIVDIDAHDRVSLRTNYASKS